MSPLGILAMVQRENLEGEGGERETGTFIGKEIGRKGTFRKEIGSSRDGSGGRVVRGYGRAR